MRESRRCPPVGPSVRLLVCPAASQSAIANVLHFEGPSLARTQALITLIYLTASIKGLYKQNRWEEEDKRKRRRRWQVSKVISGGREGDDWGERRKKRRRRRRRANYGRTKGRAETDVTTKDVRRVTLSLIPFNSGPVSQTDTFHRSWFEGWKSLQGRRRRRLPLTRGIQSTHSSSSSHRPHVVAVVVEKSPTAASWHFKIRDSSHSEPSDLQVESHTNEFPFREAQRILGSRSGGQQAAGGFSLNLKIPVQICFVLKEKQPDSWLLYWQTINTLSVKPMIKS